MPLRTIMFIPHDSTPLEQRANEVHQYEDTEVAEVFGPDTLSLDRRGFISNSTGFWIDMDRAALHRAKRIKMALPL